MALCTFLQSALPLSDITLSESRCVPTVRAPYTRHIAQRGDRELKDNLDAADLLRWWQQKQMTNLRQEADSIRNGVLQEVFAIRRRLELCAESPGDRDCDRFSLACAPRTVELGLEKIHASLSQLSDRLDPPYVQDSLPLAIGYAADQWKAALPITTHLPQTWPPEPAMQSHLLLTFLNALCKTLSDRSPPESTSTSLLSCEMSLQHTSGAKDLASKNWVVALSYSGSVPVEVITQLTAELTPIVQTLQMLSKSYFTTRLLHNSATLTLSWSN